MTKEYSSRLTRWQMRLLPFDFEVECVPGSRMGITDYPSRDTTFTAPKEKDESELFIATIKELNILKNLNLLKAAASLLTTDAERRDEQKKNAERRVKQKREQTTERNSQTEAPKHHEQVIKSVKIVRNAINKPFRDQHLRRRLKLIKQSLVSKSIPCASNAFHLNKQSKMQSDNFTSTSRQNIDFEIDSHQFTVINDLDAHISITQAQIAHLKQAGGIRFFGDRAEVYRPNKTARAEIRELQEGLDKLYAATRRKAKQQDPPPIVQKIASRQRTRCNPSQLVNLAAKLNQKKK